MSRTCLNHWSHSPRLRSSKAASTPPHSKRCDGRKVRRVTARRFHSLARDYPRNRSTNILVSAGGQASGKNPDHSWSSVRPSVGCFRKDGSIRASTDILSAWQQDAEKTGRVGIGCDKSVVETFVFPLLAFSSHAQPILMMLSSLCCCSLHGYAI